MKFSLHIEDFNKELKYNHLEARLLCSEETVETQSSFNHSFGYVNFHEIQLEIGSIFMSKYLLNKNLKLTGNLNKELVEMHFNLGNDIILGEGNNKAIFSKMHHNLLGLNDIGGFVDFSNGSSFNTFDIHIPMSFVRKWAGKNKGLDYFINEFEHKRPAMLYPQGMPITPAIQSIIHQIINCPYRGISRSIYLESKVQELFCFQIEQGNVSTTNNLGENFFSPADIEKINFAKWYIENNVSEQISIKKLSEIVGINQQKLKEGFKYLFGKTVFRYAQEYRLFFAKQLLADGLWASEIYDKIGYKDLSSFSYAFKLFFGVSPSKGNIL